MMRAASRPRRRDRVTRTPDPSARGLPRRNREWHGVETCGASSGCGNARGHAGDALTITGFDVDALRLPHAKDIWPANLIWWALRDHTAGLAPAIVAGDWNTARRLDEVCGNRGNHEFFERMSKAGWIEFARCFHEEEVQTYFKKGKGPYQLDHAFVSDDLVCPENTFEVAATPEVLAVSDHAPLVMDFALPTSSAC